MSSLKTHVNPLLSWALRLPIAGLCALVLAGCANLNAPAYITGDVTVFHQWPNEQLKTFKLVSPDSSHAASLEHQAQAKAIAASLTRWGFIEHINDTPAALTVSFTASVTAQAMRVVQNNPAFYMGGMWSRDRIIYGGSSFYAYPPTYPPIVQNYPVYERQLALTITTAQGVRVYEGRVQSLGSTAGLIELLPSLIDLLMQNFPGTNGQTLRVQAPLR